MNSLWEAPFAVVTIAAWLATPASSIGEAAEREALRRWLMPKSTQSITNFGQPPEAPPPAAATPPPVTDPPETEPPPTPPTPPAAEAAPAPSRAAREAADEKYWRQRMADARGALERDELLVEGMQSRVNALQTDVINRDDPAQQAQLRVQLQRAIDELARLQKTVDADRKAIETIQTEARRKGVPPGWIR